MTLHHAVLSLLLPVILFSFTGCTKLTYNHWQTLTLQSSKMEAQAVLGDKHIAWKKPQSWMYHDGNRQVSVNLEFVGGDRLTYSRWLDPDHGLHEIGTAAIENTELIDRKIRRTDIK